MWWLADGTDALPAGLSWLSPIEARRVAGLGYPKRRTEYLLRRLVAKQAVAAVTGLSTEVSALTRIAVGNTPDGAPYVLVDGSPAGLEVSLTDRGGWAVCVVGTGPVGCDLELVEPRSAGFVRDFLTAEEQACVATAVDPDLATNLVWSAKESALKLLRTGLRRDTRSVAVTIQDGQLRGWAPLRVRESGGLVRPGWWRQAGRFVLTVVADDPGPPPVALRDPEVLAAAVPVDLTPAVVAGPPPWRGPARR
jgi:4'-phosphopantetheinyl transferase